jgi:hypothetical protein
MQNFIRDPFAIKRLERILQRKLTTAELEGEAPVRVRKSDGTMHLEWIKKYNMRDFFGK